MVFNDLIKILMIYYTIDKKNHNKKHTLEKKRCIVANLWLKIQQK